MSAHHIDHRYAPVSRWTSICRPDDPHKTLVREDGALLYGFRSQNTVDWCFERVIAFRASTTFPPVRTRQWTEDARTPFVVTEVRYPNQVLTLSAVAHATQAGERFDLVRWHLQVDDRAEAVLTALHLDVHDRSSRFVTPRWRPSQVAVAYEADAVPAGDMFVDEDTCPDPVDRALARPGRSLVSIPHPLVGWHPTGFLPASGLRTVPQVVDPGGRSSGSIVVPLTAAVPADADEEWVAQAVTRERRYWGGLPALDLPVTVPDASLQDLLIASARNLLQARDLDQRGRPLFQIGPTMYRSVFMVDGYFLLETARFLGLDGDADHALEVLIDHVREDGSVNFMVDQLDAHDYPHHKETGIALATLVRSWELTGDDEQLRTRWPTVRRALAHIRRLRAEAAVLPADDPAHGLFPPAYTDGGLSGPRAELSTALWTLIGLRAVQRAAAQVAPEDVVPVAADADALAADLERVLDSQVVTDHPAPMALDPHDAHHLIPGRRTAHPLRSINPGTGTWALAQAIFPGELLAADHATVRRFLAHLEQVDHEQGIPAETGWLPYRAVWTYYAAFAAQVWLHVGEPARAVDYLYAFANHAAPTRVWREEQPLVRTGEDQVFGDMPHNWASAELLRLVRSLLVLERHGGLELLAGLPPVWLQDARPIAISTPTAFGHVDVEVVATPSGRGVIRVVSAPGGARRGTVSLRIPEGDWQVEVDGTCTQVRGPLLRELGSLERGRWVVG